MITINLSGDWVLKRISTGMEYPCRIPGDNISALFKAGAIENPYFADNELGLQWIGREDWSLSTVFNADAEMLNCPEVFIELEYTDTVFELFINDKSAGSGANSFLRYRFPISQLLVEGQNRIEILISSPEKAAADTAEGLSYPVPHAQFPVQSQGRNLIRKTQCHAGWDWGPSLMVSGIYSSPGIKAMQMERIESCRYTLTPLDDRLSKWRVDVILEIYSAKKGLTGINASCAGASKRTETALNPGLQTFGLSIETDAVETWWPAGHGKQPLYDLNIKTENDEVNIKVGFRTAEVITTEDETGIGMTFRINGRDIFCKGANWIPVDALPSAHTEEKYEKLIESAVSANMNMLRVWGGGQYEKEEFYSICDKKGIMIWQDFMFSCSMYPSGKDFLKNVGNEVEYQVKRLMNHPSVVLWCGNNENVGALTWFEESRKNRDRYIIDYDRLNEGVIGKTVKVLDPARRWWSSSPSAGEGDYSDCWHDDTKGDMHYWSVWHEGKPFEAYYEVIPRFCSEFGFQSFPSMELIHDFCPEDQVNITSPVMEHHQRNDRGNSIIIKTITDYFRFPEGFEELVYLSRVQQAMAITTAVEYWRTKKPVCMGALYWQLNDTWPVASWSSIDYNGGWKPLHYSAKRFFAPELLTIHENSNSAVEIRLCSDRQAPMKGELKVSLYNFDGTHETVFKERISAEADSVSILTSIPLPGTDRLRQSYFYFAELSPEGQNGSDTDSLQNIYFMDKPKKCSIKPVKINADIKKAGEAAEIELTADAPAFFTVIELPGINGKLSDNNFTLLPGRKKCIRLSGADNLTAAELLKKLKVHSLRNFNAVSIQ